MATKIIHGDCLDIMRRMPEKSIDLVFTSPPYEDARTYGMGYSLQGEEWVAWAANRFMESLRVCRGLTAWNVEGRTKQYRYSSVPILLQADLHRLGVCFRKPPAFERNGIPGSGGPDWLRNDYEFVLCATHGGKLPWSDNTACGHPPKFPPGGNPSHQSRDGRVNRPRPQREGDVRRVRTYNPPSLANPGNIIKCSVGKGHMGSDLAHENEAPFPEALAEFFIKSFCPPGGTVLDPFGGSGTVGAVAERLGRNAILIDLRESQVELAGRRMEEVGLRSYRIPGVGVGYTHPPQAV